jgi:hypothetical protein
VWRSDGYGAIRGNQAIDRHGTRTGFERALGIFVMATIVQLSDFARKAQPPKSVLSQSAEIVLFHGIRYERWDAKVERPAEVQTKTRRRKARKSAVNGD